MKNFIFYHLLLFLSIVVIIACKPKTVVTDVVDFDEEISIEKPSAFLQIDNSDLQYPEFDYTSIIEILKKGDPLTAADLIDEHRDRLAEYGTNLVGDHKIELSGLIDEIDTISKRVRSKKITDSEELLSEFMLIDRAIGEIFIEDENDLLLEYKNIQN